MPQDPNVKVAALVVFLLALFLTIGAAPASAGILYDNGGPAAFIGLPLQNNEASGTDSFVLSSAASVTGVTFYNWDPTGYGPMTSVDWSITSFAFLGTTYASGTAAITDQFLETIAFGAYSLDFGSFSIPSVDLSAGTYWLQLQNAAPGTPPGGPVFGWDTNFGVSQAYAKNVYGVFSVASEAFQILGDTTGAPEPGSFGLLVTGVLGMAALLRRRAGR